MWNWLVRAEQSDLGVFVGEGDSSEKSTMRGVLVPVIGVVAPAVADQDHLATNRGWVIGPGFGDGGLEDEGAWWEELSDGAGDGKAFTFGLPGVLWAEIVHASGSEM